MWRGAPPVFNPSDYLVASLVSAEEAPNFASEEDELNEYAYVNFISAYKSRFKGQMEQNLLTDGMYHVADPLIRNALLLKSGDFADLFFLVGERGEVPTLFQAHKHQLVISSPVFFTMFYGSLPEGQVVRITDVAPPAFELMLDYIYCGLLPKTMSAQLGIASLYVARKYLVDRLEDILINLLSKRIILDEAFLLFRAASFFDLPTLTKVTQDFIDTHIQELVETPQWMDVEVDMMLKLIQSNNLKITEINLFQALFKWSGLGDKFWRSGTLFERFASCFPYIRFPTMSSSEFANGPAKFMGKEDVGKILLHICTTVGVKPGCGFCAIPRNYTPPPEKKEQLGCECQGKGLFCFFCSGMTTNGNSGEGTLTARLANGRRVSRRSILIGTPIPPAYCACRTRGACPGAQLGDEGSRGHRIMEEGEPRLVASPRQSPRRLPRRQAQPRGNPTQNNPRNRPGWRI